MKKTFYKFLPYNQELTQRARELRKNPTDAEQKFWKDILRECEYKFIRQKPLHGFIADFYCQKLLLAIEVDGGIHTQNTGRDKERDLILETQLSIKIIRYTNEDVLENTERVKENLNKEIVKRGEFLDLNNEYNPS